jgi:transporter family-2 protein
MWVLFLIFAFLAGLALPIQFSINAQLRTVVGSPLVAATISFIVGAITLFTVSLFKAGFSLNKGIASAPWWVWTGGVLGGTFYVLATIILIPRIGAGTTVALVLAGQIVASVLIDHFGLINVPIHLLSMPRILGAILVIIGVVLIQKF